MVVVWERRVRAAMLWQWGAPLASRFLAARLLAHGRFARRAGFAVAATMLLVLAPALLVVSVLLKLF